MMKKLVIFMTSQFFFQSPNDKFCFFLIFNKNEVGGYMWENL